MAYTSGTQEIARRYGTALFELAREQGALDAVAADLAALARMIAESDDFSNLIANATIRRADQEKAVLALADAAKFAPVTRNALGLLAARRRLAALPAIIDAVQAEIARHKGETTAQVTTAQPLAPAQSDAIAAALKKALGLDVKINAVEDKGIMGGLVVRVGSMLIDSSVRTKLDRLARALKSQDTTSDQKKMKEVA